MPRAEVQQVARPEDGWRLRRCASTRGRSTACGH